MNPYKFLQRVYDEILDVVWDPIDQTKSRLSELGSHPYREIISNLHRVGVARHADVVSNYKAAGAPDSQTYFIEPPVQKLIDDGILRRPTSGVHSLTWRGRMYARALEL